MPLVATPQPAPCRPSRRQWLLGVAACTGLGATGLAWWHAAGASGAPADPDWAAEVCIVAPLQPWSPSTGLALAVPRPVPPEARCPVCGMYPARHPDWAAQAIYDDGATHFLDSPLDLRLYLDEIPRHARGRSAAQLIALYVTDAARGAGHWLDARQACYVRGSRALGPMRSGNLPAFDSRESAQAFIARRGGQALAWAELDGTWLRGLDTRHHHRA